MNVILAWFECTCSETHTTMTTHKRQLKVSHSCNNPILHTPTKMWGSAEPVVREFTNHNSIILNNWAPCLWVSQIQTVKHEPLPRYSRICQKGQDRGRWVGAPKGYRQHGRLWVLLYKCLGWLWVLRTNRKPHLPFMQEFNIERVQTSPLKWIREKPWYKYVFWAHTGVLHLELHVELKCAPKMWLMTHCDTTSSISYQVCFCPLYSCTVWCRSLLLSFSTCYHGILGLQRGL